MEREPRLAIHELDSCERPRERLLELGAGVLTDAELIAVVMGSGTSGASVLDAAARVVASVNVRRLHQAPA